MVEGASTEEEVDEYFYELDSFAVRFTFLSKVRCESLLGPLGRVCEGFLGKCVEEYSWICRRFPVL